MATPLRVFISATSADLRPACEKAASVLRAACRRNAEVHLMADMGFYDGSISSKLKDELRSADVVVHIVGKRYGRAPLNPFRSPAGYPCSYTQMEYWLAKEYGKFVPVILCDDGFPYEPVTNRELDPESRCQLDHRRYIDNADFEKISVEDMHQLELAMHLIGHNLLLRITDDWRHRCLTLKRIAIGSVSALVLAAVTAPMFLWSSPQPPTQVESASKLAKEFVSGLANTAQPGVRPADESGLIGSITTGPPKQIDNK